MVSPTHSAVRVTPVGGRTAGTGAQAVAVASPSVKSTVAALRRPVPSVSEPVVQSA